MSDHDVVIVGGGHNGLTAAAYLAKAGLDVLVLESTDSVGGGVVTEEVTLPGFHHDLHAIAHVFVHLNPMLRDDELGLTSRHGLRYVFPDPATTVAFPEGDYIAFYRDPERTAESIGAISPKDADNYLQFHAFASKLLDILVEGMFVPPPSLGDLISKLDSFELGQEMIRVLMMSYLDVIEEWFEHPKVKAALARWVSELICAPEEGGTGAFLLMMVPTMHKHGLGFPIGGSGELSRALASAAEAHGATLRTGAEVEHFLFTGERVTGVKLRSGETVTAGRAVVANLNIKQIPEMVDGRFGASWDAKALRGKSTAFTCLVGHLALSEAPEYKAGDVVSKAGIQEFALPLPELRRQFDGLKYGEPATKIPSAVTPSVWDPTRAPDGKHTLYLLGYVPFELAEGTWSERKEEIFDQIFDQFCTLTTNIDSSKVLGRKVKSPADSAEFNHAWPGGDANHLGQQFHQFLGSRPMPNMGYQLPAEGFFLIGPSTHPGAGASGGARAGVQAILSALDIDSALAFDPSLTTKK
ncbi:phytoene desaturase family protein [Dietzia timorensis]|uniref:phytoene desaturase family protein n=1 Tax=Dietzia timorensis TaxID=499555 RepID=UPI000830EBD9|nr:NAD(P)/FAD-dependent oxidoreductase [Dietzia timorensis]